MGRTLLVVHAHPDDESIATGGILARYGADGVRTVVVTCTTGDLGDVSDRDLLSETGVGGLRQRELDAAACVLGVDRVVNLGYFDSGMPGWPHNHRPGALYAAPLDEAVERLARVLDQEQPQVIATYDETGGYGHPDHLKTHQVAVSAFQQAHSARLAKLYFVRFPLRWSREFVAALRGESIPTPGSAPSGADAGPDIDEVGVPDELVTTAIDVRAFVSQKRAALACHRSQMPPTHFLMRMSSELAARLWAYEFYSRAAGPTTTAPGELEIDLFDGLY